VYKIYAESFQGETHLRRLIDEAQALIDKALAAVPRQTVGRSQ
jgi:phosphoglucomutase